MCIKLTHRYAHPARRNHRSKCCESNHATKQFIREVVNHFDGQLCQDLETRPARICGKEHHSINCHWASARIEKGEGIPCDRYKNNTSIWYIISIYKSNNINETEYAQSSYSKFKHTLEPNRTRLIDCKSADGSACQKTLAILISYLILTLTFLQSLALISCIWYLGGEFWGGGLSSPLPDRPKLCL